MLLNNKFLVSIILSAIIHIVIVIQLTSNKKKDEEIFVLNLSNYQKFQFSKNQIEKKKLEKEPEEKKFKEEKKIVEEKEKKIVEKKEKKIAVKLVEDTIEYGKPKEVRKLKKEVPKKFEIQKNTLRKNIQSNQLKNEKNKILVDKLLSEYLRKISIQINQLANKSYPLQSIKRREQGTIRTVITLGENGQVLELIFEDKRPKRLYKATKKIIQSFKFPEPNKEILNENTLKIKIPVNFIIK